MGIGRPPFEEPFGSSAVHTEEYIPLIYRYTLPNYTVLGCLKNEACHMLSITQLQDLDNTVENTV
jgi:hypothetical protein